MKRDTVLVDVVGEVRQERKRARSARPHVTVAFASGAVIRLDTSDAREKTWAEVLESLRASSEPAYIEFDAATGRVSSLLLPRLYGVVAVRDALTAGDLQVEFDRSHAVHYLKREHPRFEELRAVLTRAQETRRRLLVTNALDGSTIVDVRPVEGK